MSVRLPAGFASADDFLTRSYLPAFANCDADDLLAQIAAWSGADATRGAPSVEEGLSRVRARVLLMPCDNDKYFTVEEAEREAKALGARATLKAGQGNAQGGSEQRSLTATMGPARRRMGCARSEARRPLPPLPLDTL